MKNFAQGPLLHGFSSEVWKLDLRYAPSLQVWLVAPHSEDDRLTRGSTEDREEFGIDEEFDAPRGAGGAANPAVSFEGQDHLVDRGWAHREVPLDVGLSG